MLFPLSGSGLSTLLPRADLAMKELGEAKAALGVEMPSVGSKHGGRAVGALVHKAPGADSKGGS